MIHNHSKWEPCWTGCPAFKTRNEPGTHYPDSVPRDIVINGVVFKRQE